MKMKKLLFLLIIIILIVLVISAKRYFGGDEIPGVIFKKYTVCLTDYYILNVDNTMEQKLEYAIKKAGFVNVGRIKADSQLDIRIEEKAFAFTDKDYTDMKDFMPATWENLGLKEINEFTQEELAENARKRRERRKKNVVNIGKSPN